MSQQSDRYGGRCDFQALDIDGYLVPRARPIKVLVTDQAALDKGFCPDCKVPLAGDTGTWCPECLTYWLMPAWIFELLGRRPPDNAPRTPTPPGFAELMAELQDLRARAGRPGGEDESSTGPGRAGRL